MDHKKFLKQQASKGGKAGKGKSKRRGDSAYYRKLAKRKVKLKQNLANPPGNG